MVSKLKSIALEGIEAFPVDVEVTFYQSVPKFDVVGLPDAAVKEARERVRSALNVLDIPMPSGHIVVNMAPADLRKMGSHYDLSILMGVLGLYLPLPEKLEQTILVGELSMTGEIRPVKGVLPMLLGARKLGAEQAFIPEENAAEASAVQGMTVYGVSHVSQLLNYIQSGKLPPKAKAVPFDDIPQAPLPDFSEVMGQHAAKRGLEIAAAGSHNILLIGPPGTGKSMLAKRLPSILPDLSLEESLEVTQIYSIAGMLPPGTPLMKQRPFRAPHHSTSIAGLCGGGSIPVPGEITLAHNGILFLDELPEYQRSAMESMRQPMEDGVLTIARASASLTYPSRFTLVAAMNPCPCGYYGHPTRKCTCQKNRVQNYLGKISGPMLDRMDLHVEVLPVSYEVISGKEQAESSAKIKERVMAARSIQEKRFAGTGITCNARITSSVLREVCPMTSAASKMLEKVFDKMQLSGRAYDRILKVARTVADMEAAETIDVPHLSEALQYRTLDRKYWSNE